MSQGQRPSRAEFFAAVEARLSAGERVYGDASFARQPNELVEELEQEALDLAGWSYVLWCRLRGFRERVGRIEAPHSPTQVIVEMTPGEMIMASARPDDFPYSPKESVYNIDNQVEWSLREKRSNVELEALRCVLFQWCELMREQGDRAIAAEAEHLGHTFSQRNLADVYFFGSPADGVVKIGHSHNIKERLEALRRDRPDLRYLGHTRGGCGLESLLHQVFRHDWVEGEWFKPSRGLLQLVEMLTVAGRRLQ